MALVILEAMDSGLPVIATPIAYVPEIVENEVTGLIVNKKDPQSIAEAIDRIMNDNELARKLVEESKKKVKEFSRENTARGYVSAVRNVLSQD